FPKLDLYYIEFDAECVEKWKAHTSGATVFTGDQEDAPFLQWLLAETGGGFDVIVDDGGHTMAQQRGSLEELWGAVKPGGVYFVEDLQTSYMGHYGGDPTAADHDRPTMMRYIFELLDDKMVNGDKHPGVSREVRDIDCMREMCALFKKKEGEMGRANDGLD